MNSPQKKYSKKIKRIVINNINVTQNKLKMEIIKQ